MENLCTVCRSIFTGEGRVACTRDKWPWSNEAFYHHRNLDLLEAAANAGCDLCRVLVKITHISSDPEFLEQRSSPTAYNITHDRDRAPIEYTISFRFSNQFRIGDSLSACICIYKLDGDRYTQVFELAKQTVSGNTGSDEVFAIASQWISDCVSNHKHCNRGTNAEKSLPTRLLYVGPLGAQYLRLCNTKLLRDDTRYMTLSHCWGHLQLITLMKSNITTFQEGIKISKLPRTFRDAIYVSWRMSIQYIWIDSLCIIQDSEDDWKRESALMMSVYSGAFCNIAATGAPDARTGLFFDRNASTSRAIVFEIPPPQVQTEPDQSPLQSSVIGWFRSLKAIPKEIVEAMTRRGWVIDPHNAPDDPYIIPVFESGRYSIEENRLWRYDVFQSPLIRRAWVLQEQLLAKRTLHFTTRQLYFGCQEHIVSEIFEHNVLNIHRLGKGLLQDSEHTTREPAAAGQSISAASILSTTSSTSRETSLAVGAHAANLRRDIHLPESREGPLTRMAALERWLEIIKIYTGLNLTYETDRLVAINGIVRCLQPFLNCRYVAGLWDHQLELQLCWYRGASVEVKKTPMPTLPTWSWASSNGLVCYATNVSHARDRLRADLFKVLSIEAESSKENGWSSTDHGRLRVVGKLIPVMSAHANGNLRVRGKVLNFHKDNHELFVSGEFYCSILLCYERQNQHSTGVEGLLWKPSGKKRGEFQRVGHFGAPGWSVSRTESADIQFCLTGRGSKREKAQITEDLYESYDKEKDVYTFTIV